MVNRSNGLLQILVLSSVVGPKLSGRRTLPYGQLKWLWIKDFSTVLVRCRFVCVTLSKSRSTAEPCRLATYASGLAGDAKERYLAKLCLIDNVDPMLGAPLSAKPVSPPVDSCHLVSYLVLETSFMTGRQFKNRKGLDAYNQFVNGWVKEVKSFEIACKHVSVALVSCSTYYVVACFEREM